jgi:hypothetical protein
MPKLSHHTARHHLGQISVPTFLLGPNSAPGTESGVQENVCASRGDFEQDLARANDPQYCVDYVADIMDNLIQSETKLMPSSTYMDTVILAPVLVVFQPMRPLRASFLNGVVTGMPRTSGAARHQSDDAWDSC